MGRYRDIPDAAVARGKPASPYLMRALRDNDLAIDANRAAVDAQLDEDTGHVHSTATKTTTHAFEDRIEMVTGFNDKLPIRFGGGAGTVATTTSTLTAAVRTLAAHAAHVQTQLRASIFAALPAYGSAGAVPLTCTYDTVEDSETRGFFLLTHTGATDSPNPRIFELLFESGTGAPQGAGPSMGYAMVDRTGAYGYVGDSGFADSFTQLDVTTGDGGLLDSEDFEDDSFTTAKFTSGVVPARAFQTGSVSGGKMVARSATGVKVGLPETTDSVVIDPGDTHAFTVTQPNGGSGRKPMVTPIPIDACLVGNLLVSDPTHTSGDDWSVDVTLLAGAPGSVQVALAYY